ncbi:MAG TPA: amine oxidase, partial [Rhodospirillaceae bacterium]|nr:amine oxidase [Rhodospirillaceae bacterium]
MRIAIIGTGISGLGAAYLLNPYHDIAVYEKEPRIGGHSRTVDLVLGDKKVPVDTGFIVFNKRNYPHLTGLFEHLGVNITKSDMSFGASIAGGMLEYGSKGMFAQKRNWLRPAFWRMIADILRFNRHAARYDENAREISLGKYLDQLRAGSWFKRYYLQAMGAAIWSCSVNTILSFPAETFLRFFKNHGLLTVNDHPQWYTVAGGSRQYIEKLTASFGNKIKTSCAVVSVSRLEDGKISVQDTQGQENIFDHVIFASHADQTLKMLKNPTPAEAEILSAFTYQPNTVVLHEDDSFMPRARAAWASWVYLSETRADDSESVSLSYWMNNLQPLDTQKQIFITLNPGKQPVVDKTHNTHVFSHPVFTRAAISAQKLP